MSEYNREEELAEKHREPTPEEMDSDGYFINQCLLDLGAMKDGMTERGFDGIEFLVTAIEKLENMLIAQDK